MDSMIISLSFAEVVGSNPTSFINFILGKYGIILSFFYEVVGQRQQQY